MPEFMLRAPASAGTTGDDVFVTGDPSERARLLAAGYTDVADDTPPSPEPRAATPKPAGPVSPPSAPATPPEK